MSWWWATRSCLCGARTWTSTSPCSESISQPASLEEALAFYEGDFLTTVGLAGAREFEHWAEGVRQQLAAERRQLLRTLMAKATDQGQWSEAARYARGLIEEDPLDLDPRLRLVELMALSGDLVGAQVGAGEIRRLAAETQGKRLPEAIETAIPRALLAGRAPERRQPAGFPRHPDMVGRATEFRRVVERWKTALEGRGSCVLISGEPGSGKTRLVLDAFTAMAEEVPVALLVEDLHRASPVTVDAIALQPLDAANVAHLLSTIARVPDERTAAALATRVVQHTAGVPLYVLELLKALYDGGQLAVKEGTWVIPDRLTDDRIPLSFARSGPSLLRQRLAAIDQGARALLAALAVWGREATVQEIAQIVGLSLGSAGTRPH